MKTSLFDHRLVSTVFAAAGVLITATDARSAAVFTETADNAYYNSGFINGSSQTDNFAWFKATVVTAPGFAGHFIGNSTNLAGGSGGDINTGNESWGMYGGSGGSGTGQANAYGFLKDGSGNDAPLSVGQTLSLDLAVNFRNGYKGVAMRNAAETEVFTFNVGGDDYTVLNATTGNGSIGNTYSSNSVFHISVTQTTLGGGSWSITRGGGVTDFDTGTYTGLISNFKLYVGQTEGGSSNDLFANNISVIPEPGTTGLLLAGSALLVVYRRRRAA